MTSLDSSITVIKGDFKKLGPRVQEFVAAKANFLKPDSLHICDGSDEELRQIITGMQTAGSIQQLPKYENCWLVRTNPADVARVESKTVICTESKRESIPIVKDGVNGTLGHWMDIKEMDAKLKTLFDGCMKGRTMYLIPFSMGPVGSPLSKYGIELTDSPYVVCCMKIMTRMGQSVLDLLAGNTPFVRCTHSVGKPQPCEPDPYSWPCNPEKTLITHFPKRKEIISFGSGYGGNSLLGKKCFALRIASTLARDEGWLSEHMLILGITNPKGEKKYITAAFPSACGKTNLAMMTPTIPGWKIECVGDDIAWMKFDEEGNLRAINPEAGFFGVCPGTSYDTNPMAMRALEKDSIFTNTASTSDGGFFWEGLEKEVDLNSVQVTSWLKERNWKQGGSTKAAHPNSRFCAPAKNCPIMDPEWEGQKGVPISAVIFGGRRPEGVPLVYESFDWNHGVFVASSMCSEATAAAEHKSRVVMRDPFAMRPFFGYNAGQYVDHWLKIGKRPGAKLPKIFHVNWFRKDADGKFMWPGFGENSRVLEWIFDRTNNADNCVKSPVGNIPKPNTINVDGLGKLDMEGLMSIPKKYWKEELESLKKYYEDQFNEDLPKEIWNQYDALKERINNIKE